MNVDIEIFNPCTAGLEYYESKDSFEQAWEDCIQCDWMLWLAYKLDVNEQTITRARARCVNTVRNLMKDKRSIDVIDASLQYAVGEISRDELDDYVKDAIDAYNDAHDESYITAAALASAYSGTVNASSIFTSALYYALDSPDAKISRLEIAKICRETLRKDVFDKIMILQMKNVFSAGKPY